ncbi:MAG: hypothetical protein ACRD9R_02430 [Pyrinomonadaceae bacterium]
MSTQTSLPYPETAISRRAKVASPLTPTGIRAREKSARAVGWAVAVPVGALHLWAGRHEMNLDGISYLDMGDAYLRGDWAMAVNAYWSPLYSWLLGLVMAVFRPSPAWEFPVARLLNFALYLVTLVCFDFFLRRFISLQRRREDAGGGRETLPAWAWVALGYALFIWTSLSFVSLVTPDMCVAACVYLAAGLLLRVRQSTAGWLTFGALGVVLGLGYLAKAAMFPLAFVFLLLSLFAAGGLRRAMPRAALALVCFLLIAGPFVFTLSHAKGRLTFSDSGRLNYLWLINDVPVRHWQGESAAELSPPSHPTRRLLDRPALYEFGMPVGGTYPVWYDPSYWYEGAAPSFNLRGQMRALGASLTMYHKLFLSYLQWSLLFCWLVLFLSAGFGAREGLREIAGQWPLLALALAALSMYALIVVEPRYVAPFIVLFWLGLFSAVRLPPGRTSLRVLAGTAVVMTAMLVAVIALATAKQVWKGVRGGAESQEAAAAEGLKQLGLRPGDKVAAVYPVGAKGILTRMTSTARLARVSVVAEIPPQESANFWAADAETLSHVREIFSRTGAKIILTEDLPKNVPVEGWRKVGQTKYHAFFLAP